MAAPEITTDDPELRDDLLCLGLLALFTGDHEIVAATCELIARYDPEGWAEATRLSDEFLREDDHAEG